MSIKIIAAMGKTRELGNKGGLPLWHLKSDMENFKKLTLGFPVVMGRKSFLSLPEKFRPLPGRRNIVLTKDLNFEYENVEVFHSVGELLDKYGHGNTLWVIGGGEIYKEFVEKADELHLTHVDGDFEADTFFPEFFDNNFKKEKVLAQEKDGRNSHSFEYSVYRRK